MRAPRINPESRPPTCAALSVMPVRRPEDEIETYKHQETAHRARKRSPRHGKFTQLESCDESPGESEDSSGGADA